MFNKIILTFENGLPRATAQQRGEKIRRKANGQAYIQHYRKPKVQALRTMLGFWLDDAQVVDERIVRHYSEKGTITIQIDDLKQPIKVTL